MDVLIVFILIQIIPNFIGILYDYKDNSFVKYNGTGHGFFYTKLFDNNSIYLFGDIDIYTDNSYSELFFAGNTRIIEPYFITSTNDLESSNFDNLVVYGGSGFTSLGTFDNICFNIYNGIYIDDYGYNYYIDKTILLNSDSSYYYYNGNEFKIYYYIPKDKLGINFSNGKNYKFELKERYSDTVYSSITFTISGLTSEDEKSSYDDLTHEKMDEQTDAIREQTEVIQEQNETSKGIWSTLIEVLSYINPFSENFFVYKLIELLIEALKGLFVPSDDFFDNYFTELKNWFSDRLGFLFYPFEILIDIFNRILNINFSEPIFNIPNFIEPSTGNVLIASRTFNLNSILENSTFETIHNIYLVCVDAFIIFELVNLLRRKYEEVTTK